MRRKEKEIQSVDDKLRIIEKCKFCRLGLCENNQPYNVPLNYGYSYEGNKLTLYFHSAKDGKKIDILKNNNNACFEIDCDTKLVEAEKACDYGYEFKSILGFGKIIFLETDEEKSRGLNHLMKQQTGRDIKYDFGENELKSVLVYKMEVEEFSGKEKVVKRDSGGPAS